MVTTLQGSTLGICGASASRIRSRAKRWFFLLIAIVKKKLHLNASLYTCLQILLVSGLEKTEISCALQTNDSAINLPTSANQLNLFDI